MNKHAMIRRPNDLSQAGLIPVERLAEIEEVAARYAVSITPAMAGLIDAGDAGDPIARQFLPSRSELHRLPEERDDPIGDGAHEAVPGLVHRYPDRVLLKLANICAGLLPLLFPPRERRSGPACAAFRRGSRGSARLCRGNAGDLGGRRHRRRPADPLPASAHVCRGADRPSLPRQNSALAHTGATCCAGVDRRGYGHRVEAARPDDVAGTPRQPSARVHPRRACGDRPPR